MEYFCATIASSSVSNVLIRLARSSRKIANETNPRDPNKKKTIASFCTYAFHFRCPTATTGLVLASLITARNLSTDLYEQMDLHFTEPLLSCALKLLRQMKRMRPANIPESRQEHAIPGKQRLLKGLKVLVAFDKRQHHVSVTKLVWPDNDLQVVSCGAEAMSSIQNSQAGTQHYYRRMETC
jgi:hypothetical protein